MGGQAQAPGMGNPLSIAEDQIWFLRQKGERLYQPRAFPEGEEARDIGEFHLKAQIPFLQNFQFRKTEEEGSGPGPIPLPGIGHIGSGQGSNGRDPPLQPNQTAQFFLEVSRLL